MSISTTTRKAGPFAGNGIQTVFAFAFKVFATADVVATRAVTATGVETTLALSTDYSVTLNGDQDNAPGGSITLVAALAVGQTLAITSDVAALQPITVTNGGGFFASVFNIVFDRLTILVQQLAEAAGRALTVPVTSSVTNLTIPVVPSAVLQWDPTGTALIAQTLPDLSLSLALPSQAGHANQPLFSNGAAADWRAVATSDVTGLDSALSYLNARIGATDLKFNPVNAALAELQSKANFALNAAVIF